MGFSDAGGRRLHGLVTADAVDRTTVAAWSCVERSCGGIAPSRSRGHLAWIDVTALRAGAVNLRIDSVELVARDGSLLTRSVRRGRGATAWGEASPRPDPSALAAAWMAGAERGDECSSYVYADVDGDGCLTIADVQTAAYRAATSAVMSPRHAMGEIPTMFVVNSTGDAADAHIDGVCQTATKGECTLRAALQEANAASGPAAIDFAISGSGVHTIAPQSQLPPLTNPSGITINGLTQPGSSANTDLLADNAVYGIELKGKGPTAFDGLIVASSNNTIEGLDIHGFVRGIWFNQSTSDNNTVIGDMVGLLPNGSLDPGYSYIRASSCIVLQGGASHNQIGEPGDANRNVVSGCDHVGVATYQWPTKYNTFQNNIVGLDPTGTQNRGSFSHGFDINEGTQYTLMGGTNPGDRNVLSGNKQEGIEISHNKLTVYNSIIGNFIGTDLTGNAAPAYASNQQWGVHLEGYPNCGTSTCPLDEGFETVTGNVIVDSKQGGVMIDKGVHDSVVTDNKIGLTNNGTPAGNSLFGVNIEAGSVRNRIGPGNEIAYNAGGIVLRADGLEPPDPTETVTNANTITQNSIHDNTLTGKYALGIDLAPLGQHNTPTNADPNVNDGMIAPTLSNATASSITASTCAQCTVELFIADRGAGQYGSGKTYVTTGVADSTGHLVLTLPNGTAGQVVTATATNPNGSTSEFSKNVAVP